jgi:hypothetical protein
MACGKPRWLWAIPSSIPKFKGNVASVDTRDFWREVDESPRSQDYHYHRNPEFYLLCGEAMGRAMVRLLGGEAAVMPKSDREAEDLAAMKREAATPKPTEAGRRFIAATKAMVLDGLMQAYLNDSRNQKKLEGAFVTSLPKPEKLPDYLDDPIDDVVAFFEEPPASTLSAGSPCCPDMPKARWDIFGFDLANNPYDQPAPPRGTKAKPIPVELKWPAGQENWFAKEFDVNKAGWKKAPAPFGKTVEKQWPENVAWIVKYPLYPAKRPQPTTVINQDVLLMRGTFDLPPVKRATATACASAAASTPTPARALPSTSTASR